MSTNEPTGQSVGTPEPAATTESAATTEHFAAVAAHAEQSAAAAAQAEHSAAAAAQVENVQAPAPPPEDLRAAAGLGEQPARGSRRTGARRRRTVLITTAALLLAAAVISLVYLGQQNRRRYHLVCGAEAITAAQGRGFPPWGQSALAGDAWRPIPVAPSMPCTSQNLDSRAALARQLGEMLVARADAWVIGRQDDTGREQLAREGHAREGLASVQAQLEQARLLLREAGEPGDPAVAEGAGRVIERLQGDVDYWSARARVEAAMATLDEAAAQLDQAVAREPRHNGENAASWQRWLARIRQDLASGPQSGLPGAGLPGAGLPGAADDPNAPGSGSPFVAGDPNAPGSGAGAAIGAPGPAQEGLAPAGDAGVGTPDATADPALPTAPGTAAPTAAPRKAPAAGVPRGGQLI